MRDKGVKVRGCGISAQTSGLQFSGLQFPEPQRHPSGMDAKKPKSRTRRFVIWLYMSSGVAIAAALGWMARVDQVRQVTELPLAALNVPLDLGRISMTPLNLWISGDAAPPVLVLRARLENITGETQDAPFGFPPRYPAAQLGEAQLADPRITLSRDNELLHQLHPRMPETVQFLWTLSGPPDGEEASITFFRQNFKLRDNIHGRAAGLGHEPAARLVVAEGGP
ncbi:MAG: hypothetical protein ACK5JR_02220 [Tropicimonas sp.]|uniref:hypothetical protein n=1 Tax=Tropicimonas sp. TaxID=2067044 RepID=UPI003A86EB79